MSSSKAAVSLSVFSASFPPALGSDSGWLLCTRTLRRSHAFLALVAGPSAKPDAVLSTSGRTAAIGAATLHGWPVRALLQVRAPLVVRGCIVAIAAAWD